MTRFHSLALAAALAGSMIVPTAVPAAADQGMEKPFAKPPTARHHTLQASRRAIVHAYPVSQVAALRPDVSCGSLWCGRQFVLMLGIGF